MNKQQIQLVIDSVFDIIESKESGLALILTQALQRSIDANLEAIIAVIQKRIHEGYP